MRRLAPAALTAALVLTIPSFGADPELDTDEEKILYTLGFLMSGNLVPYNFTADELAILEEGLVDGAQRRDPAIPLEQWRAEIQKHLQVRAETVVKEQEELGKPYREKVAAEEGARTLASGLIFKSLEAGDGASPTATDAVTVHYKGTLIDGTVFDDSHNSPTGGPATFQLSAVVPCFREGIQQMRVGGKAKIVCPASLAYGARGFPPKILGGATLTFEVELIGIGGAKTGAPAPTP